jgi:cation transport regulator ChaB
MDNMPEQTMGLPKKAKEIWIAACNAALEQGKNDVEAAVIAWTAVKKKYEKGDGDKWRAKTDISLGDISAMIRDALQKMEKDACGCPQDVFCGKCDAYLKDVYGAYVIYEKAGKCYKLAYSILEGVVQFGVDAVEVERAWVEARSQQAEIDDGLTIVMRLGAAVDSEGKAWDVTICEPGFTKNGWYIPDDVLRDAAGLFENVDVNLFELPTGATHLPDALFDIKSLLVKNKVGWIEKVKHVAGEGLKGVLHFVESAKWLGKNLLSGIESGGSVYGLSYDCPVRATKADIDGKSVFKILKFLAADSVDIVSRPAAGGRFNRAIAAQKNKEGSVMDKKELWDLIHKARPGLLEGKDVEKITDEEIKVLAKMAMEPAAGGGAGNDDTLKPDELKKFRCEMALEKKLGDPDLGLPLLVAKRIKKSFEGRIFADAELDQAITEAKDELASLIQTQREEGVPASRISGGLGTLERAQMAVDRMLGLSKEDMEKMARKETLDHQPFFIERFGSAGFQMRNVQDYQEYDKVPAFRGIREAYSFFTGDPEITGFFNRKNLAPELRARMDINSSTFTYVLGNTLGRRLMAEYAKPDYLERLLVSVEKPVKDFRSQEAVKVGGFPDLATVDPETADYAEIAAITDEEVTYTIIQKGNLLSISRKTIINDDISILGRAIAKLGRVARRTLAKYIWDMYISNGTCTDATAVFTSGHGNLGATALSHSTALTAWKALAAMTEKDSGEYLGLLDGNVMVNLVGPPALKDSIGKVEKEEFYYSSNDLTTKLPNSLFGQIKGHTLSLLAADANDWYMILPPDMVELIEMGYLNGRKEPELFVADSPQSEQVFVADKIRHKIRFEFAGASLDYVGAYKAVVT